LEFPQNVATPRSHSKKKSRLGEKLLRYADTTTLLVKRQKKYVTF